jgi:hypothetical protein
MANSWQILKQLKYVIQNHNWTGTSNCVFNKNSVIVSANPELHALSTLIVPICIIKPLDLTVDPEFAEERSLIERQIQVTLITCIAGDSATSENAVLGSNRTSGSLKSEGRGLLELEEELFSAIQRLTESTGVKISFISSSGNAVTRIDTGTDIFYVSMSDHRFKLFCGTSRTYEPVRELGATVPSVGLSNDLYWNLPPDRYDLFKIIVRKKNGTSAPTSPTDGTGVTLSSNLATSVSDTIVFGSTTSYSVFAAYDETHSPLSTEERYSAAESITAYPW